MLSRLADLCIAHPRRVGLTALLVVLVAAVFGGPAPGLFGADRAFDDHGSQSTAARVRVTNASGHGFTPSVLALVDAPPGSPEVAKAAATFHGDPGVAQVFVPPSAAAGQAAGTVSRDGQQTVVGATLRAGYSEDDVVDGLTDRFDAQPSVRLGGPAVAGRQVDEQATKDLASSELFAFPLLILLSLLFFRGVAALLPLVIGVATVFGTFSLLRLVNMALPLSPFALNLVIGLGLGLAVDYSLFVVSRFREELSAGADRDTAVRTTLTTAGRTVLFSAATVAAAMLTLCLFPQRFLVSMGLAGVGAALVAALAAITILPLLLIALSGRLGKVKPSAEREGRWYAFASWVMRHPLPIALATSALMLVLAAPSLRIHWSAIDAGTLPASKSARVVQDTIARDFAGSNPASVLVAVEAPPAAGAELSAYAKELSGLPGVASVAAPRSLSADTWAITVNPDPKMSVADAESVVHEIRATHGADTALVGGAAAEQADQQAAISRTVGPALLLLILLSGTVLWLMTGSLILPIKTLIMTLLTAAAAAGMLVFVFQDGRLEGLLDYQSTGGISQTNFIVMVAIVIGLSTDYGVFLLTRIKEARDRGLPDREAVAIGLQRTGSIVTAAAVLLAVAIGAFMLADLIFLKQLGFGAAFAVLLDAFVVRALLVPSLMALLGAWNWWQPAPLRRLHARIGISEGPAAVSADGP